jgi:sulfite reductase (ferredoxin)
VLSAARALLITRGAEAHGEEQVFDLFLKHFVDEGLVEFRFRPLLESARSRNFPALLGCTDDARDLLAAVNALYQRMDDSFHFKLAAEAAGQSVRTAVAPAEPSADVFKDLRGVACPMNFVKAKIVLDGMKAGQRLSILLDEGAPIQNVPGSIRNEGHKVLEQTKRGDHWLVLIEKR